MDTNLMLRFTMIKKRNLIRPNLIMYMCINLKPKSKPHFECSPCILKNNIKICLNYGEMKKENQLANPTRPNLSFCG